MEVLGAQTRRPESGSPCTWSGETYFDGESNSLKERGTTSDKRNQTVHTQAVSEVIGTLVLIGVVMIGIVLVGILLLSNPAPSKVPVFDSVISNRSKTIYIYHKGGDSLPLGTFKILVDGNDTTSLFTIMSPGTDPWGVGETLTGTMPYTPRHVVIIFNQSGGGATILAAEDLVGSVTLPQNPNAWYFNPVTGNCNWKYRKMITIDHTKVSADQSSFPVLVSLTDTDLSAKAQSNGNDILFTSSDGTTKLNHEIENYTSSTGSLVAWVGVPTLSSATDTVLYLYYGNSTATGQQNPAAVWDANFKAVWHLVEVGSTGANAYSDSTSNANNGQGGGGTAGAVPAQAAGQISYGQSFDGANDYIATTNLVSSPPPYGSAFTESIWFQTTSSVEAKLISLENQRTGTGSSAIDWMIYMEPTGNVVGGVYSGGSKTIISSPMNNGNWHYAVLTYYNQSSTDTNLSLYVDGSFIGSKTSVTPQTMTGYLRMGSYHISGNWPPGVVADGYYSGALDEARYSTINRSSTWIATEYANQNSPSTFSSVGNEETWWKC